MTEVDEALVRLACDAYDAHLDPGEPSAMSHPMRLAIEAVVATLAEKSLRG